MAGDHYFGGEHTENKLRIVKAYLQAWTQVLKNQQFESIYIDPFAGTGSRTIVTDAAPLFGEEKTSENVDGSARIALGIDPPFDRYIFIESDRKKFKALEDLKSEFREKRIETIRGDANENLKILCRQENWKGLNSDSWGTRAVLLLDPYGMNVEWTTLQSIAETKAIDMWFLFSIGGLTRQVAHRWEANEDYKIESINRCFGTDSWQDAFYKSTEADMLDFAEVRRTADENALNKWVKARLGEIFPWVSEPVPIIRQNSNTLLFSLFFGIGNPSGKAIGAARRIVTHLQKNLKA